MVFILKLLAFLMMFFLSSKCIHHIANRNLQCGYILILVFYFLFGLQPFIELFIGDMPYGNDILYSYFAKSYQDGITNIIFYSLLIAIPMFLYKFCIRNNKYEFNIRNIKFPNNKILNSCLIVIAILPIIFVILSKNPLVFFEYAFFQSYEQIDALRESYQIIYMLSFISTFAIFFYILCKKNVNSLNLIIMFVFFYFNALFNGKRTIVLLEIVLLILILYLKVRLSSRSLFIIIAFICINFFVFNGIYINYFKASTSEGTGFQLFSILNDFSRSAHLKMEIYCRIHNDYILEYSGQSIIYDILFFIPRNMWENKPYPYAVYFTAKELQLSIIEPLGWGFTTNIYGEVLSNFGFIGLGAFLVILVKLCRYIDKMKSIIMRLFSLILMILFSAVQLSAFIYLLIIFIFFYIFYIFKSKIRIKIFL